MALQPSDYIVIPKACSNTRARLVCFPHSGGGPSAFANWPETLEELKVEVVAISLPGHERRVSEPPIADWKVLVADICDALSESGIVDDVPYAFFGHSFGSILAYEVARRLDATMIPDRPRPIHVFVSAHSGPTQSVANRYADDHAVKWGGRQFYKMDEAELLKAVEGYGFLPAEVLSNEGLLKAVIPALRADFQMFETYEPDSDRSKPAFRVTALYGNEDSSVNGSMMQSWGEETTKALSGPTGMPGGHFYLYEQSHAATMQLVHERIEEGLSALPRSVQKSDVHVPDYLYTNTVQGVIKMRRDKHPDMTALVDEHESVTYKELMRRTDLLAMDLHQRYLHGETGKVVALLMAHDITYIIGELAIFTCNCIFIVIEAHFPPDLAKEIGEENGTVLALSSPEYMPKFESWVPTMEIGKNWLAELEARKPHYDLPAVKMTDNAILMMTSGTTGRPKTIAGDHFFMTLGYHAKTLMYGYQAGDRHAHNVMFVWEVLAPLMYGDLTSYILPDAATLDPTVFVSFLQKHEITHTLTTPSLMNTILQYCSDGLAKKLTKMKTWLTCGEVLSMKTVHAFYAVMPHCRIINDYSTWESGDVSYTVMDPKNRYTPNKTFSAAGYLAPCRYAAVIDPDTKQTLPRGICGELYVGGKGISNGYFANPDVSKEKFLIGFNDEMKAVWDGKWYKTGDLCRFVGEPPILEIRGRIDSTVKIRGFKVGIPIVEAAIQEVPGVGMCGVVPIYSQPGIVECLCAFVGPKDGVEFEPLLQKIKEEGPKKIPRWMMPTYIKLMPGDALGGGEAKKLDRRKLASFVTLESLKAEAEEAAGQPAADAGGDAVGETDESGVRGILRSVWAKTLNLNARTLDLDENFFDLGGHSTLAARMAGELSMDYGLPITVLDIYSNSSLGALFELVDPQGAVSAAAPKRVRALGKVSLEQGLAIVGLSGRFPGADHADSFWQNLQKGAVSATFLSPELLRRKGIPEDVISNKDFVPCGYMMNDVDKFDHIFFGIGKHEATIMDPQHRVFIETSWAAAENAALAPRSGLAEDVVGVFAAAGIDGYLVNHLDGAPLKDTMNPQDIFLAEIGSEKDYIATRVSYLLGFTGPSMNVNSACSSAIVAISQAGVAITFGQCDAAVAGGSSVTFPNLGYRYQEGLVSSVDGYVRPFDKGADGTVFGDSVGAVVLRRNDDVQSTKGLTWGSLIGFAVSNDGAQKAGYAAPSSVGQSAAIMNALNLNQTDPWSLSYVECHATGTRIGDGIEVRGLIDAFNQVGGKKESGENVVALGSVKGNIAHANCAAGITGMIKLLSMVRSKQIAPTANFKTLNPKVNLSGTPFQIQSELTSWDVGDRPIRGGVSSFGIGGTNGHCIVEAAPAPPAPAVTSAKWAYHVLPFAAKSPESLKGSLESLAAEFKSTANQGAPTDLAAAAFTLQTGREKLPLRKAVLVKCAAGPALTAESALSAIEGAMPSPEELDDLEEAEKRPSVAFIFPGQGSQYLGMGGQLYSDVPLFKKAVDQCCELLMAPGLLGMDIRTVLFSSDKGEKFAEPSVLQPCLFVIEYAMAQLMLAVGVSPVVAGGHSLGEYVAATVGGLLTLEDALTIVASRAKATETLAEDGAMLSIADWSQEELDSVRNGDRKGLWLAAVNSPVHAVISGETTAVEALEAELKAAGKKCARLHIRKAFHSGLIAKAADTLQGLGVPADNVTPAFPVTSNYTGGWMNAGLLKDGSYWLNHMRNGVMWRDNAEKMMSQWTPAVVVEVGPGNALSMLTKKCIPKGAPSPLFLQAMRHPKSTDVHDVEAFLGMIGQLWEAGCDINWQALHTEVLGAAESPPLLRLPTYSFSKISLWEKPERSVYVEGDAPVMTEHASLANLARPGKVSSLVRFGGDEPSKQHALRAYCLPFASGSSLLFAPWAEEAHQAVDIVAVEMPGRGGRADDKLPTSDAEDAAMINGLCRDIIADARGLPFVLVGFSMGGNLSVEITLRLAAMGAQAPLAIYVAGRKPPAADPSTIGTLNMSDEALASYAMAPVEVVRSAEFRDYALPLLRSDLELDMRVEKRLSSLYVSGHRLPEEVSFDAFCGTQDEVAPWAAAKDWQRFVPTPIGVHFMPGGHEFLRDAQPMLLTAWRQHAIGRLVQKQIAALAALGAGPIGAQAVQAAPPSSNASKPELPFYAVRWVPAVVDEIAQQPVGGPPPCFVHLAEPLDENVLSTKAAAALQSGGKVFVFCDGGVQDGHGLLNNEGLLAELQQCWRFVHFVQRLLEAGSAGRIVVVCPAAASGGMVVGASKAVAMEASELTVQRVFVGDGYGTSQMAEDCVWLGALAEQHSKESDIWITKNGKRAAFVQRLEHTLEPSAKLPCVAKLGANGKPAVYILTGATGGLGSSVVEWLVNSQHLAPEQLVLLRRSGSTPLTGILSSCRVVEVESPHEYGSLMSSGLMNIENVTGVFHLAGVLDDGIIGGMTEERVIKVAKPKCAIAVALLRTAVALKWPLNWFLGFSSTSSLFGYGGQVNYAAANGVLDNLAAFGSPNETLPCRIITINWGPWGEVGMAKVGTKAYEQAVREGDTPLKTAVGLRCLAAALRSATKAQPDAVQFCACDVDWERSHWKDLPIVDLVAERQTRPVRSSSKGAAPAEAGKAGGSGATSLEEFFANYTSQPWSRIKAKSLVKLGLDSLEIVQLRNQFNKEFGVNVPLRVVADPSQRIADLATAMQVFVDAVPGA